MWRQQWKKNWKHWRKSGHGSWRKSETKKGVIDDARNKGRKAHFASLMDLCHLKNSELEPQYRKYKGRVVLPGDIVKDDSGSYAAFTEQGSSASQTTAAKVMDIISRLPGCSGQAADAVSAYTQVKMEDASTWFIIPKSECPDIWIRLPKHKWPTSWSEKEGPVVPLERNLYGHLLAGLLWKRQFETVLWEHVWEKVLNWECLFVNRARGLLLSVYVDDIKLAGKNRKHGTDLENSHERRWPGRTNIISWPRIFWDALKESVKSARILRQTTEICSNPGFLLEPKKNYRPELQGNLLQKQYLLGLMTWKVTQRNVWKDIANLQQNNSTII